jgi:transketolase
MVFGEHLARLGDADSRIVVLDADTSTSTQTAIFAARHPERFINCGIAEANMVSVAAGIATTGLRPVVSAFAVLLALRAGDQIRAQVAYTGLPVVLVGGYAGLSDFADGGSHQSIEDLATFLAMPNLTVVCPGDATETELALEAALRSDGPVFLRLSRAEVGRLDLPGQFEVGRAVIRRQGGDVAILATGQMLEPAMHAAVMLAAEGIEARLIDLHTVKPLDEQAILDAACECGCLITCEEHNVIGGVGSRVASLLAARQPTPLRMVGISDEYGQSGAYDALREHYGLTAHRVVATARELLARVNTEQGGVALRAGTIQ